MLARIATYLEGEERTVRSPPEPKQPSRLERLGLGATAMARRAAAARRLWPLVALHLAGAAVALGATLFAWRSDFEAKTSSRWVNCAALLFGLDACGLQLVLPLTATALAGWRSRAKAWRTADLAAAAGTGALPEAEAERVLECQPTANAGDRERRSVFAFVAAAGAPSMAPRPDYALRV